jgi:hypothetical protein
MRLAVVDGAREALTCVPPDVAVVAFEPVWETPAAGARFAGAAFSVLVWGDLTLEVEP